MNFNKIKTLMDVFFNAQFNYYSLLSMLHISELNTKMSRNIQCLPIALYHTFNGTSFDTTKDAFLLNTSSNYEDHYIIIIIIILFIPKNIKSFDSLPASKRIMQQWKPDQCSCGLCQK